MNYEEAISEIQGNQRYNLFILLTFSMMAMLAAMDVNSIVFMGYTPPFRCVDGTVNLTNITWFKDQCFGTFQSSYKVNRTYRCSKWQFEHKFMIKTITTEFQLVCDKSHYVTIMSTLYFVGIAMGNFFNIGGDKIGRIKMIKILIVWEIIINTILPFMTNISIIMLLRLLIGFGSGKLYQGICYLTEIISLEKRSLYTNNYWILYVFGYMLIPGIAFQTQDWRLMRYFMNIPMLFYLICIWIPESPRWLGVGGRTVEARQNLLIIAKRNGKNLPTDKFDSLTIESENLGNFKNIFDTKTRRVKTLVLIFSHGTMCICYFGLSINETFISNNIFLNVFIQGLLELLTGPVGWIASTKLNRKKSLFMFYFITFICLLVNNFTNPYNTLLTIVKYSFAVMGKFSLSTGYCIMDMYLNEVFPTPVRSMAMFLVLGIASTFTVLAPTVNGIDKYVRYFSSSCYSVMCFISGFVIYFLLPETKGCPLPQTLFEGDELRKGNEKNYCKMILQNGNKKCFSTTV